MSDEWSSSRVAEPSPSDLEHDRLLLSDQEAEVVRRTRTKSYATVADELEIAESTVGTYRTRATERLDEQVQAIKLMLRQQQADERDEGIEKVAREAVERLKDCGVDVEFEIEPETDKSDTSTESPSVERHCFADREKESRERDPVRTELDYKENLMNRGE